MKKLNYSFLSSKFFDWAMKNDPNGTVTSMKSWISIFCSHQFKTTYSKIPEKERRKKRGEKNQIKEKGNRKFDVLRFKADYESLFTKNLLSSSVHVGTNG